MCTKFFPGETIRFRVVSESFVETLPTGPAVAGESVEKPDTKSVSPYTLGVNPKFVSMSLIDHEYVIK